jgi:membrane protein YdbS with pleckstrin-like domain
MPFDAHAEAAVRPKRRWRSEEPKAASAGGPIAATVRSITVCLELCIAVVLAVTLGAFAAQPEWIELMAAAAVLLPATLIYAAWTMRR